MVYSRGGKTIIETTTNVCLDVRFTAGKPLNDVAGQHILLRYLGESYARPTDLRSEEFSLVFIRDHKI